MMVLCNYGCNQEAKFQLKNGKWCCSKNWSQCPEVRLKNSLRHKKMDDSWKFPTPDKNPAYKKNICKFCSKPIGIPHFKDHENSCYLNPDNIKLCPVCEDPIKNYRITKTCSGKCAAIFFKDMYLNCNKVKKTTISYRDICWILNERKCIICNEVIALHVHHYDENDQNHNPENLIPLCANHHFYAHTKYKILIEKQIEVFVINLKLWIDSFNLYLK